ncbi:MAG: hypothetical protein NT076_00060 [Candidatus Pacearchaeota archaeon]|nr:hypothetical protein [Candidatus Pacearchaeota archaeon]
MVRVKFTREQQKQFIDYALQNLKINLRKLAEKLNVNYELIKKYHQEACSIDEKAFLRICKLVKINFKELEITLFENNWGRVKGGKRGIAKMREKYAEKLNGIWACEELNLDPLHVKEIS